LASPGLNEEFLWQKRSRPQGVSAQPSAVYLKFLPHKPRPGSGSSNRKTAPRP
jgi:hypothetical protein